MQQLGDISVEQAGFCSWERAAGFRYPGGIRRAAAEPDTGEGTGMAIPTAGSTHC